MATHESCAICLDPVSAKTTGRLETTCGHVFHFKCLSSWFSKQGESSCPLCRQKPTELEDFSHENTLAPPRPPQTRHPHDVPEGGDTGVIYISRLLLDTIIRAKGGFGVSASVEAEVGFNERGYVTIRRPEFERILQEQGCPPFSDDASWNPSTPCTGGWANASWNEIVFTYNIYLPREGLARDPGFPPRSTMYLSRLEMDGIIRRRRGLGVNAVVEAEVEFDEHDKTTITRPEFERIIHEQGGWSFSDPQWNYMASIYRR